MMNTAFSTEQKDRMVSCLPPHSNSTYHLAAYVVQLAWCLAYRTLQNALPEVIERVQEWLCTLICHV